MKKGDPPAATCARRYLRLPPPAPAAAFFPAAPFCAPAAVGFSLPPLSACVLLRLFAAAPFLCAAHVEGFSLQPLLHPFFARHVLPHLRCRPFLHAVCRRLLAPTFFVCRLPRIRSLLPLPVPVAFRLRASAFPEQKIPGRSCGPGVGGGCTGICCRVTSAPCTARATCLYCA